MVRIHKVKYCEEESYAERKLQRYKAGLVLISTHNYQEKISEKEQAEKFGEISHQARSSQSGKTFAHMRHQVELSEEYCLRSGPIQT